MTRDPSEPVGLGVGIGIPTGQAGTLRQRHCPGAMLRLTRQDYLALHRDGQPFSTGNADVGTVGLSDVRAFCSREVAEIRTPQYKQDDGRVVVAVSYAALCPSCSDLERNNRADLLVRKTRQVPT